MCKISLTSIPYTKLHNVTFYLLNDRTCTPNKISARRHLLSTLKT